ncbi:MAG: hypothetical protein ACI9QD_000914 [Thermoproteota archaeon]|jgi:hypothetical protein
MFSQFNVFAYQDAIIKAKKAIIYSDILTTSPLGFVKEGRKVKVSDLARNKGRVFQIVVSGRIAYIKSNEVQLLDGSEVVLPQGHKSIIGLEIDKHAILVDFSSHYSSIESGIYTPGAEQSSMVFFSFKILREKRQKRRHYSRFGFEYLTFSQDDEILTIPSLVYQSLTKRKEWGDRKLLTYWEFGLSPFATYEVDPYFNLDGFSSHFELGLKFASYWTEKWSYQAGIGLRVQSLFDFALPSAFESFSPTMVNANFSFSVSRSY